MEMMLIFYLFGYRIIDDKVGFPNNSYNKVINSLEENYINYNVMINDLNVNFKKRNRYNKFLELGKRKFSISYRINCILEKLNTLDEESIDQIIKFIEEKL